MAGSLRLEMAQYRELLTFSQLGTDLDKATQNQLHRGEKLVEVLKQLQYVPLPMEDQVLIFFAASHGGLDMVPNQLVPNFEKEFLNYVHSIYPEIPALIKDTGALGDEEKLNEIMQEFCGKFVRDHKIQTQTKDTEEEDE